MSTDGETLTLQQIAATIAVDQRRDPGLLGVSMSMVELGAWLDVFGYVDRQGVQRIGIATPRSLYEEARLPDGWSWQRRLGILGLFRTVFRLARALPDTPVLLFQGL